MPALTRRRFVSLAGAGVGTLAAPRVALGARPSVVVIGGGAGGATAARYLAEQSAGTIAVTLIEPNEAYYSCFFSNHYLGGLRDYASIGHTYEGLAVVHGVNVVHEWARAVDRDRRVVELESGGRVAYDRLIVAPGIDIKYDSIEGYSAKAQAAMPHAYRSGTQVQLLKVRLEAMRPGGTFVIVAPPNPARCPPGPYERACVVASFLRSRNPTGKVVIVDHKDEFAKQELFVDAWQTHYPGMIEWVPLREHGGIMAVDPEAMEVRTVNQKFAADVANVIPAQRAGSIAFRAELTAGDWCPVVPATMQAVDDAGVHVIGDATAATPMPKSAFAANSQAKAAADAVCSALVGTLPVEPGFSNTCWSILSPGNSVKIGANYTPGREVFSIRDSFVSAVGEDNGLRQVNFDDSLRWYAAITDDMFGPAV